MFDAPVDLDSIRAVLTHEPNFGMTEIDGRESNYQLSSIGCILKQISRRLKEGAYKSVTA